MATQRRYVISLNRAGKAKQDPNLYIVSYDLRNPMPRHELTADKLADVIAKADALAAEYGKACKIYIRCLDRKPPGFDNATASRLMFRNMEHAELT